MEKITTTHVRMTFTTAEVLKALAAMFPDVSDLQGQQTCHILADGEDGETKVLNLIVETKSRK